MKRIFLFVVFAVGFVFNAFALDEVDKDGFTKISKTAFVKPYTIGKPAPTIIFIHGANGVRGLSTYRLWSRTLNEWGYNAVVVDLFSARGFNEDLGTRGELVPFSDRAKDIIDATNYIRSKEWHNGYIGLIGFSQGGPTIFATSDLPTDIIKVGVAFYPACGYVSPVSKPSFDIQLHVGLKDDMSLPHLCKLSFWTEKSKYNINEYENATHGFDINAPARVIMGRFHLQYDEEAFLKAREKTREYFDMHLK